jgi:hypothetical protein
MPIRRFDRWAIVVAVVAAVLAVGATDVVAQEPGYRVLPAPLPRGDVGDPWLVTLYWHSAKQDLAVQVQGEYLGVVGEGAIEATVAECRRLQGRRKAGLQLHVAAEVRWGPLMRMYGALLGVGAPGVSIAAAGSASDGSNPFGGDAPAELTGWDAPPLVDAPNSQVGAAAQLLPLLLAVDVKRRLVVRFGGLKAPAVIPHAELARTLSGVAAAKPDPDAPGRSLRKVVLFLAADAQWQHATPLMVACARAGFWDMGFAVNGRFRVPVRVTAAGAVHLGTKQFNVRDPGALAEMFRALIGFAGAPRYTRVQVRSEHGTPPEYLEALQAAAKTAGVTDVSGLDD